MKGLSKAFLLSSKKIAGRIVNKYIKGGKRHITIGDRKIEWKKSIPAPVKQSYKIKQDMIEQMEYINKHSSSKYNPTTKTMDIKIRKMPKTNFKK